MHCAEFKYSTDSSCPLSSRSEHVIQIHLNFIYFVQKMMYLFSCFLFHIIIMYRIAGNFRGQ